METGVAKIKVRLGNGQIVEVVPLRRAWQPRFFLAREADDKPVLMIHETQVVWEKEEPPQPGHRQAKEGEQQSSTPHPGPLPGRGGEGNEF